MLCHSHVMVGSSTVTGLDIKDKWSMLFFALLGGVIYYIVIALYVLVMWSVLFVMYVGGMF